MLGSLRLWLRLWLLLLLLARCLAAVQPAESYRPRAVDRAAVHVLRHHISPSYNAMSVMQMSHSRRSQLELDLALDYLLHELGERMSVQMLNATPIEEPRDYILFLVDTPHSFAELRFHFAKTLFDREFNFVIVLSWRADTEKSLIASLYSIFRTCLRFHVMNAVVLVQPGWLTADVVHLYGFRLYALSCNVSFTPELLDRYERGELLRQEPLFGRHLGTFYGCPLNISWYPLPPYVMFDGDRHDPKQLTETWRLTGVDGELIKLLASIFKFRLNLLPPCEQKSAALELNASIADCFRELASQNSSVIIGAMSGSHMYRANFSTTSAYHQSALVFVVRVDQHMGAVNQLVQPFCPIVWLALVVSCLALLLLHGLRVHTTLLGNPLDAAALPRASLVRCYLGAWLLLALVQRAAYQGKLYDAFRLPYYPPAPEHIVELLEGHYQYLTTDYDDYFPAQRSLLRRTSIVERFDELQAAEDGARLTTSALLGSLAHYNDENWQSSRLTHVKEHIYLVQLVMCLHRHSILKFAFDRKLKQLQSAGIVGHISRNFEPPMFHMPYASHEVSALRLEMFYGLNFICYILLLASVLVFLLELLSQRVVWLRRYLDP
ncbi:uncharacterized protein LOC115565033 [Drosophila navojoa]|uniref:uncharacterized protein LOC115565033 n=1 Tax=Drosophila navojoa TaxID=7232 RepID=UPI000847BEC9|nr:uncharacterized protein LOC115565033 [Drosophila navojoa]